MRLIERAIDINRTNGPAALAAWRAELSPEQREQLQTQIDAMTRAYREIGASLMRWAERAMPELVRLSDAIVIAEAAFRGGAGGRR